MNATIVRPAAQQARTAGADENHIYCCNPDLALCGADLSQTPEDPDSDTTCVVCTDLEASAQPCGTGCRG